MVPNLRHGMQSHSKQGYSMPERQNNRYIALMWANPLKTDTTVFSHSLDFSVSTVSSVIWKTDNTNMNSKSTFSLFPLRPNWDSHDTNLTDPHLKYGVKTKIWSQIKEDTACCGPHQCNRPGSRPRPTRWLWGKAQHYITDSQAALSGSQLWESTIKRKIHVYNYKHIILVWAKQNLTGLSIQYFCSKRTTETFILL